MPTERVYPLDADTLGLFALKGSQGGGTPQVANANGLCVRRVIQIICDFAKSPFDQLRVLDLACGEGVYAIEAALRGAEVVALDARTERMNEGVRAAERLGLYNLRFEQTDIRNVDVGSHGRFDIVCFLGILYHLDEHDVFPVLQNIYEMCRQYVIIDTHIALRGKNQIKQNGKSYEGRYVREHADHDSETVRKGRLMASLDNSMSFWFTRESLFRLLNDVGFTSVCECIVPLDPIKRENRITIIASKGKPVIVSSYPWVNDKTEDEIKRFLGDSGQSTRRKNGSAMSGLKQFSLSVINGALRSFGLEIRRM